MEREKRERALRLLSEKKTGSSVTHADIEVETGYSRRQLMRLAKRLETEGEQQILTHGSSGGRAHNAATGDEIRVIRELKRPYPDVTIAHFRDIYIEDVMENPARAEDVERYGLVARSASWFRDLFAREGWRSPAQRGPRRDAVGRQHPKRLPLPRAGMMAQVDGTPYDWFGDGRTWCMRLSVDDATTGVLAGWFMERECMRGYARMMREVVTRHGIPRSMYSDEDSVFRAVKDGSPTQFALMMRDLGVHMIFANSPQAKGRVERYNSTAQLRLPTDIVRFGIPDYDVLNAWFNEFYAPYLNSKFSYRPADPRSDFMPPPDCLDLSAVFRTRETRLARGCSISYGGAIYMMADRDGVMLEVPDDTKLDVHVDAITEEMYVERSGKRWSCVEVAKREGRGPFGIQDRRDLQRHLAEMQRSGGYREG